MRERDGPFLIGVGFLLAMTEETAAPIAKRQRALPVPGSSPLVDLPTAILSLTMSFLGGGALMTLRHLCGRLLDVGALPSSSPTAVSLLNEASLGPCFRLWPRVRELSLYFWEPSTSTRTNPITIPSFTLLVDLDLCIFNMNRLCTSGRLVLHQLVGLTHLAIWFTHLGFTEDVDFSSLVKLEQLAIRNYSMSRPTAATIPLSIRRFACDISRQPEPTNTCLLGFIGVLEWCFTNYVPLHDLALAILRAPNIKRVGLVDQSELDEVGRARLIKETEADQEMERREADDDDGEYCRCECHGCQRCLNDEDPDECQDHECDCDCYQ